MNIGSLDRKDKRSSWAASSMTGGSSTGGETFTGTQDGGSILNSGAASSSMFDSFPPVTLTVSSFFKQVGNFFSNIIYGIIKIYVRRCLN